MYFLIECIDVIYTFTIRHDVCARDECFRDMQQGCLLIIYKRTFRVPPPLSMRCAHHTLFQPCCY